VAGEASDTGPVTGELGSEAVSAEALVMTLGLPVRGRNVQAILSIDQLIAKFW